MKKIQEQVEENYYDVKMTKTEMLKILSLYFGKEANYEELERYARNVGGLPYHLIECYKNAK